MMGAIALAGNSVGSVTMGDEVLERWTGLVWVSFVS